MNIKYVGAYWDKPYGLHSFISIDETEIDISKYKGYDPSNNKRIVVTFRGSVGEKYETNWRQDYDHRGESCFGNP